MNINKIIQTIFSPAIFLLILFLASLLRFLWLDSIPSGFEHDEAANGYAAYSLALTQRDEYGTFLPLYLKSVGDYRSSFYALTIIPFIKMAGLNELSVRLPAAIAGILTVVIVYYLVQEIFNNKNLACLTAFLLAISPWHIIISRLGFDAVYFPWIFCLACFCYIKSFKHKNYLILSALLFGFSLWSYYPARGFIPIFLLGLLFIAYKYLWQIRGRTFIAGLIFLLILIGFIPFWFSSEGMARAESVGVATDIRVLFYQYLTYFSPDFLFFDAARELEGISNIVGNLYLFELIAIPLGIFYLLKNSKQNQEQIFNQNKNFASILIWWLILYPFPSALVSQATLTRGIIGVPILTIFAAYGIYELVKTINSHVNTGVYKNLIKFSGIVIFSLSFFVFAFGFFANQSDFSLRKGYGIKQAINYTEEPIYSCVEIRKDFFYRINYHIAFYTKYSPENYQKSPIQPQEREYKLGKYLIQPKDKDIFNQKCLQMVRPYELKELKSYGYTINEVQNIIHPSGIATIKLVRITSNNK